MKNKSIDDYIARQSPDCRPMLKQIRSIIRSVVPGAEELTSYMIPCYKQQGMLVGFGVHKNGCSFYHHESCNPIFFFRRTYQF